LTSVVDLTLSCLNDPIMPPKEPTRAQLSSRLSYNQHTPSFLLKLQSRIAGRPDEDEDYDNEFEYVGSGRPPIPRRPAIPGRPEDDPGSADEDSGDEKPQVVVLKQGKHLTEQEAENVRRKEKGLPSLTGPGEDGMAKTRSDSALPNRDTAKGAKTTGPSLSFSSSKGGYKSSSKKRKVVGDSDDGKSREQTPAKKKPKKASKVLLSFGDDA